MAMGREQKLAEFVAWAENLNIANRIEAGEPVTAPGVPKDYPRELLADDCIKPPIV